MRGLETNLFDRRKQLRVYTAEKNYTIDEIERDGSKMFDILLVSSLSATEVPISLGVKRLAEACHQASLAVAVLGVRDPRDKAERMADFEGYLETLLNLSSKC